MNKTLTLIAAGLAACAPKTPDAGAAPVVDDSPGTELTQVTPPTSLQDDDEVTWQEREVTRNTLSDALDRLEDLELVVVGQLIVDAPEGAANCYGPCYTDPVTQTWLREEAAQVERLTTLVEHAEHARADTTMPDNEFDEMDSLQKLSDLQIIEVEAIDWEQDGACYVSLCESDFPRRIAIQRLVASIEAM